MGLQPKRLRYWTIFTDNPLAKPIIADFHSSHCTLSKSRDELSGQFKESRNAKLCFRPKLVSAKNISQS